MMNASGDAQTQSEYVALVTGASRGVGRGVALALADSGLTVYVTGRNIAQSDLPNNILRISCDHTDDAQVRAAFDQIRLERGRLDILVNNAWGGYENMLEDGEFTWSRPFWLQPLWRWDAMMTVGVRAALVASQCATLMMIGSSSGLIVNLSFWAAQKYLGNVLYGCAKAATDKLTADMAHELAPHSISVVSLYPGLVRTEAVMAAAEFLGLSNAESPEFIGCAVLALAREPNRMGRSGQVVLAANLGLEYGFTDVDGRQPRPLSLAEA